MTTKPQALANNLSANPAPNEFVAMGQALVGEQPSLIGLINRCADSMQAEKRVKFEEAFITEQTRILQVSTPDAVAQLKKLWLVRESDGEYKELVAKMAWWAWQTASSTT